MPSAPRGRPAAAAGAGMYNPASADGSRREPPSGTVDSEVTSVETWQTTEAGRHFRTLLEGVRRGEWQLVGESGRAEAVLAAAEEISDLLRAGYRFRPKTTFGGQGTEIWLPEVEVHVAGATLEKARRELAEAMIRFAADWEEHRRHAADYGPKAGYVRRIQLAGDQTGLLAMLDRDAESDRMKTTSALTSPEPDGAKPRRWMGPRDRITRVRDAQADQKP